MWLNIFLLHLIRRHIPSLDAHNIQKDIPALAFYGFHVIEPLRKLLKCPKSVITIDDYLKKRRMYRDLLQVYVARIIGVWTDSITYSENDGGVIQIQHIPRIIEFLGFNSTPLDNKI